ncbi:MAG: DNA alkylation repair protein [Chloroflexi bacterium]|nr:DNA alkylation repair protein [Chloroflexota bacterium]
MHSYVKSLQKLFKDNADPKQAAPMKRYMRDQFDYLGIKGPKMGELLREFIAANGLPPLSALSAVTRDLWVLPQREFQYVATSLISRMEKQLPEDFIETLEYLLVTKSWWDTVDTIATGTIGLHFKRYPKVKKKYLAKWRKSSNFWLRRAAILFQLNYKHETDFGLLKDIIRENLGSQEFFINKAIGWALRQYTRIDPVGVRQFVAETELSPLSAREALKWLARQTSRKEAK